MSIIENSILQEISVSDAAKTGGVSEATILNWIKTGNLRKTRRGYIDAQLFHTYLNDNAGSVKLGNRANKSRKDTHNHTALMQKMNEKIKNAAHDCAELGSYYEENLSESYRNKEGIYYTPVNIIRDIFSRLGEIKTTDKFFDPSCGSGNYIVEALNVGFLPENIYGCDTDPIAVELTKKRIFQLTGYETKNIECKDFLKYAVTAFGEKYDYIFTNPPWGKKISKPEKEFYKNHYRTAGSTDTSSLFFFAAARLLNENGHIGFLLPESFFNVAAFEGARRFLLSLNLINLTNYERAFKGLLTRAQSFIAKKTDCNSDNCVEVNTPNGQFYRKQSSFSNNPKSIINLYTSDKDAEVINRILSLPHTTLKNKAQWALGIVTGNNKKFLKKEATENHIPVYKGSDITKSGLKRASNFIPDDFSLYQQVAPLSIYRANPKLVYKFISNKICLHVDKESRYFLNSANMLVLDKSFPLDEVQTAALLNSDLINWFFQKIFNSHKVLRKDLESLPIHYGYFDEYDVFKEDYYLTFLGIKKDEDGTYGIES